MVVHYNQSSTISKICPSSSILNRTYVWNLYLFLTTGKNMGRKSAYVLNSTYLNHLVGTFPPVKGNIQLPKCCALEYYTLDTAQKPSYAGLCYMYIWRYYSSISLQAHRQPQASKAENQTRNLTNMMQMCELLICLVRIIFVTKLCVNQIIQLTPVSKIWGISTSKTILCTVKMGCKSHLCYKHVDQTQDWQFHLLCE